MFSCWFKPSDPLQPPFWGRIVRIWFTCSLVLSHFSACIELTRLERVECENEKSFCRSYLRTSDRYEHTSRFTAVTGALVSFQRCPRCSAPFRSCVFCPQNGSAANWRTTRTCVAARGRVLLALVTSWTGRLCSPARFGANVPGLSCKRSADRDSPGRWQE